MNYGGDSFASNIAITIAGIARIGLPIFLKVRDYLDVAVWIVVLICLSTIIPGSGTIIFIICKCTGVLSISWWWIILAIVLDSCVAQAFFNN